MGNRLSYEIGKDSSDVDYGGTNPANTSMPRSREGDPLATEANIEPKHGARFESSRIPADYDSDCYEIPATAFSSKAPRRSKRQKQSTTHSTHEFDFNDSRQPLPWNRSQQDGIFEVAFLSIPQPKH